MKDYFRNANDSTLVEVNGEGIERALGEAVRCENDPNCGNEPDNIWDWMTINYYDKQSEFTREQRDEYYEALRKDIARMIAQDVDPELFRKLGFTEEIT